MASYKHQHYVSLSNSDEFDKDHKPGATAPYSGIYLCMVCGREYATNHGELLPSQNHHEHAPSHGPIRWRLIVYASHQPD